MDLGLKKGGASMENKVKIIAFYLPQFHEIEENNKAWGKGFTEWDNVKKAMPLFEGHYQPREPLNDNYYNLLNPDTLDWQVKLAKKYGVYGFCFYHYWFRDGRRVLEKPSEMLLNSPGFDIPFCFSWANEPWTRTWHGAAGEKEVLIEQRYGDEGQWKEHFAYLLPFFKDRRYIKVDGKPVFLIYQINKIGCFNRMADLWESLAIQNGIPGIYIVDMLTGDGKVSRNKRVFASVDFEPGKEKRKNSQNKRKPNIDSYDEVCLQMINTIHKKNEYRCIFVDYDDTPRRGMDGNIFPGSSPDKFGMYLQKIIEYSQKEDNSFVFLNAWNEWGEGNYLEPDKKNGYAYLEAVQKALQGEYKELLQEKEIQGLYNNLPKVEKFRQYYELCNQWIKNLNDGYCIGQYFIDNKYTKIAIYGMGELGNRLVEALENTPVTVCYGISKNMWDAFAEIDIKGLDEKEFFNDIDCIVVTPVHFYKEIEEELRQKSDCDIISLEDVVYGL